MTRILLYGASGMLGTAIREQAPADIEVVGTGVRFGFDTRADCDALFDLCARHWPFDVAINCVGMRPERNMHLAWMAYINGVVPHLMAAAHKGMAPVIHVSTDCVLTLDSHYARTKLAGESDDAINVRTSFVGPRHGLWAWLVEQAETPDVLVHGWNNAWWSGSTVDAVAKGLLELARDAGEPRTLNLSTDGPVSKYRVLKELASALDLPVVLKQVFEPRIDRRLRPDIELPPFAEALREMVG